jgi:hypothetical protein
LIAEQVEIEPPQKPLPATEQGPDLKLKQPQDK